MRSTLLLRNVVPVLSDADKAARTAPSLPTAIFQAIVGQMLSDGYADKSSPTSNTRLSWSFGGEFVSYAQFIATLLSPYCNTGILSVSVTAKKGGNVLTNFRLKLQLYLSSISSGTCFMF